MRRCHRTCVFNAAPNRMAGRRTRNVYGPVKANNKVGKTGKPKCELCTKHRQRVCTSKPVFDESCSVYLHLKATSVTDAKPVTIILARKRNFQVNGRRPERTSVKV